ncbi:MAG TPA: purine phosphorylase [Gammaproteobacteria bacterium]|nr:purine phosphorylase [Gammaproteobacteria bacterium]
MTRHLGRSRREAGRVSVRQCGPGAARAARAAADAIESGAAGLVSWGLAGGLDPAAAPGTLVLPRRVVTASDGTYTAVDRTYEADASWRSRLAAALAEAGFSLHEGPLLGSDVVLRRPEDKARAAAATGAVAVDMESAGVADAAAAAGVPFVALRVVADAAADVLPVGIERWIDERGNRRFAPAVDAALRPADWPPLLRLARRYGAARRTLLALAALLAPSGFLLGLGPP